MLYLERVKFIHAIAFMQDRIKRDHNDADQCKEFIYKRKGYLIRMLETIGTLRQLSIVRGE
jgi:hypothetical protein